MMKQAPALTSSYLRADRDAQASFLPNGMLANRANLRRHFYELKRQAKRMCRVVEWGDVDGKRLPMRVLHETKGWQSARIAGRR